MTVRDWYTWLLEDNWSMEEEEEEVGDTNHRSVAKCRVERLHPSVDWQHVWRLARLPGLGPENCSFLFKLIHQLLPTQERIART